MSDSIKIFDSDDKEDVTILIILSILLGPALIGSISSGIVSGTGMSYYSPSVVSYNGHQYNAPVHEEETSTDYNARINAVLSNIDPKLRGIISVMIVDKAKVRSCGSEYGCESSIAYADGKPVSVTIYLITDYRDSCYTFEYVLYHEIGHVDEQYKYGNAASGSESYANNFADRYTNLKC